MFFRAPTGQVQSPARTRDDAAGEAFDKVAKLLGLGYPGGPLIEKLATAGVPGAIKFSVPRMQDGRPDFSFSGLKTAVSKYVRERGIAPVEGGAEPSQEIKDLAAGFQNTVVRSLVETLEKQVAKLKPATIIVAGGVACNEALRAAARLAAARQGVPVYFPSQHLSTDNAAMIAAAGTAKLLIGQRDNLTLNADVSLRLQNYDSEDEMLRANRVRYRL
ncbi:MAG: hypothetical protein WKF30_07125 [Pyrinomonadaceae bacterium]